MDVMNSRLDFGEITYNMFRGDEDGIMANDVGNIIIQ